MQQPQLSKLNVSLTRASLLCAAVGVLGYLNTLGCGFCYDDTPGIINNPDLKSNVSWSNLLWDDFWGTPMNSSESHKSYRPLCVATFRLNYMLHELQPMGYHLVNVLLHGVVCYLYVQLCGVIFSEVWPALIAGLLFAVHPIHTEAVASVIGRADVLSGLFFVVTLLCYKKTVGSSDTVSMLLWLFVSMLSCVSALVSKETGFTVVAACIVYDFFVYHEMNLFSSLKLLQHISASLFSRQRTRPSRSPLPRWLGYFVLRTTLFGTFAALTALWRLQLNNGSPSFTIHDNPPVTFPSPWRQIQWLHLCFVNFWLLLNPFSLSCDWRMGAVPKITSLLNIWNLATIATLFGICSLGFYSIRNNSTRHSKPMIVSLALIVFPYIPASNLFFTVGFYVAERVLYIPSMGVCILVSCSVWNIVQCTHSKHMRALMWLAISSLLIAYTAKTVHRNQAWNSNYDLYTSVLPIFPNNAIMMNNLGVEISKQGDMDKGTLLLKTAAVLAPNITLPHLALARLYREHDQWEEAERWYTRAARLAPTDQKADQLAIIYYELGLTLIRNKTTEVKRLRKALELFNVSLSISSNPKRKECLHNKGYVLLKLNQFHEAKKQLEMVLEADPNHPGASHKLAEVFFNTGDLKQAEHYFRRALFLDETNLLAKFHIAALSLKIHSTKERLLEAAQLLTEVLEKEPENENAVFALGVVQHNLGEDAQARRLFEETLTLNSSHLNALYNVGFMQMEASNFTAAKDMFQRLLDLNPAHSTAKVQLASCLVRLGQTEKGLALYEEVIQTPLNSDAIVLALTNLGAMKRQLGELKKAVDLLSRAVAMDPTNQIATTTLSKAKQELSQSRNATTTNGT